MRPALIQCPGCGQPTACSCTPAACLRSIIEDRAELSRRAALGTARANEAARLLRLVMDRNLAPDLHDAIAEWLRPVPLAATAAEGAACEKHSRAREGCRDCYVRGLHAQLDAWRAAHAAQVARVADLEAELAALAATEGSDALPSDLVSGVRETLRALGSVPDDFADAMQTGVERAYARGLADASKR